MKIAAKQLVFLHFWYLGTAKSNEKLAENLENSSKTASFPSFFNGWQQETSEFRNFSEIFQKFREIKFLLIFELQKRGLPDLGASSAVPRHMQNFLSWAVRVLPSVLMAVFY